MTATPREPTGEEVEGADLRCMGADALMNEADKYLPAGPPQMEIYRRLKECDALLAQAPKEWTAEEIKDAPEGEYRVKNFAGWNRGLQTKEECLWNSRGYKEDKYFGPIPPPEEKGG